MLAWSILDGEGVFPTGAAEVDTMPVVELVRAFTDLVSGDLSAAPKSYEWFHGTPSGREELKVREC